MTERNRDEPLAVDGGTPVLPEGPPPWPVSEEAVRSALLSAYEDGSWGQYEGRHSRQLCAALQKLHGVEFVLPCCSGTFAVELALRGLGVKAGDEVILAGYDFPGNFRAIEAIGAFPVLADIHPRTWSLDVEALDEQMPAALGPMTRAVVVSHLHGGLVNMQRLIDLASQHGLRVVEDACQAPGAELQGKVAGAWGDVGVLSFGGSKLLSAGRGGAIVTNDASVYQRAKIYCERGNDTFPLSELQAAVLLPQISQLQLRNAQRRANVQRLMQACSNVELFEWIASDTHVGLPSYYKVACRCRSAVSGGDLRDQLVTAIRAEGVSAGAGFRGFVRRGPKRCRQIGPLPHSTRAAVDTILLHHPVLLEPPEHIDRVAAALRKVARHFAR